MNYTPVNWTLPNRIGYNNKIFKTFRPEFYEPTSIMKCDATNNISDETISLFPQQRLIKDYMQIRSPYRGALLYHELGSGKSGASIAAAEGYLNKRKMYILSPASLAVNYENEIYKISSIGLNLKKDWKLVNLNKIDEKVLKILKDKYAITSKAIKKNLIWIPVYDNDIPGATIVKTTVNENDKSSIDQMISHIIRNRYTFISYNGLSRKLIDNLGKSPFDNSFVIIDEVHNFSSRIVNGSKLARDIYLKLMNANDCKLILLSGTPIINNPYEIATIINLIRGYMSVYEISFSKTNDILIDDVNKQLKEDNLLSIIDELEIDNENKKIRISLLPNNYKKTIGSIITNSDWNLESPINSIIDSINKLNIVKLNIKYSINYFSALPNIPLEFNENFLDTSDEDNPDVKNKDLFMRRILGTVSYYSICGSELFPNRLPDVTRYLNMSDTQFKKYSEVRAIERKMDAKKGGVIDDKSSVYRAFSRMVCNFTFPENIERLYPIDIKKAIKQELDEEDVQNERNVKRNIPRVVNIYENSLKSAINDLITGNYLTYTNVKNELSPKFAAMYDDIKSSPGSVLVYSQFRTVEGLGLLAEFLKMNGFKEIDLKKVDGKYQLTDITVFNKRYDNKRFVIFSQDKEKTRYLMNLFNGDFNSLPKEIQEILPENINQLYGKLIKLFCITASGAEGISLKNVRRVLIMEPYWNNIRIDQVIGRAIRSCSHKGLPPQDQNVGVYRYIMKFTKKQVEKDYSISTLDNSISTDEHISIIAQKKMSIINKFLTMLKASSFDCIINAKQNKPLANGYKCYNWAIGVNDDELAYTPNINDDYKIMKHKNFQILKKDKGKVIIKDGVKYVRLNGKDYNYHSYISAGILIPE